MAERDELSAADIDATIGEILDEKTGATVGDDERKLFVPIGLGALDVAMAESVYNSIQHTDSTHFRFV